MALAANDSNMEARIARLESDVSHIRSDLADVNRISATCGRAWRVTASASRLVSPA